MDTRLYHLDCDLRLEPVLHNEAPEIVVTFNNNIVYSGRLSTRLQLNIDEQLPAGDYEVVIYDSAMKTTKAQTGQYLALTMEIVEGEHKGRKLWDNLNIINPNEQAQTIANEQLSRICDAVGIDDLQDSEQLHNIPLIASVSIAPAKGDYPAKNVVKSYSPVAPKTEKPKAQAKPTASTAPAGVKKAAWGKQIQT